MSDTDMQTPKTSTDPWQPQKLTDRTPFVIPWEDEEQRRVPLTHGQWVELRTGEDVTEAGRRNYKVAALRAQDPKADTYQRSTALAETDDYMIAMFVRTWSFGDPIPQADIAKLRELPGRDYDLLVNCCTELVSDAFPDFSPTPDTDSPFLEPGTTSLGTGGRTDRPAETAATGVAAVPAGQDADRVDAS